MRRCRNGFRNLYFKFFKIAPGMRASLFYTDRDSSRWFSFEYSSRDLIYTKSCIYSLNVLLLLRSALGVLQQRNHLVPQHAAWDLSPKITSLVLQMSWSLSLYRCRSRPVSDMFFGPIWTCWPGYVISLILPALSNVCSPIQDLKHH